mgnify:CR=1 FL=1
MASKIRGGSLSWSTKKDSAVQTTIHIDLQRATGWEQWGLLCADQHLDNPACDRDLHRRHLQQAADCGAFVLSFGDLFDAMQGKTDRRSAKDDLLPDVTSATYLNDLVHFAADFYRPFSENLALMGEGNHETAVTNKLEYSLLDGLVHELRTSGSSVIRGGYRGWIRFQFYSAENKHTESRRGYYMHGSGGGGPVTKGVIQSNRRAAYLPDADYVFSGHIHEQWILPIQQLRVNKTGTEYMSTQYHVQLPTYKDEFCNEPGGFAHETSKPPKPIGAWWIRFYWSVRDKIIKTQFVEADK